MRLSHFPWVQTSQARTHCHFHPQKPKNVTRGLSSLRHGNPQGKEPHTRKRPPSQDSPCCFWFTMCECEKVACCCDFCCCLMVFRCQEVLKNHRRSCFVVPGLLLEIRDGDDSCSVQCNSVGLSTILRGFWARGRVRGDRSVFVTSHRPVHLSRALLFSAWFELLHFRTGALFLV